MSGAQQINNLSFAQQWRLDATGNWSGFVTTDVATPANNLDQQRVSNPANEITDVTRRYGANWVNPAYDRAGNMTTIPGGNDPTVSTNGVYDAWNRLVSIPGTASYSYDGLNRRTTTTVGSTTRHAYYTSSWQNIEERVGTSTTPDRQFVWGLRYIDDLVLRDRSTTGTLNERLYAMQDANWNVTSIVDATGAVKERYRYSPYGVPTFLDPDFTERSLGGDYQWETLYAGYRWDNEIALYHVRWRYLNPLLGCWITRDPVVDGYSDSVVHRSDMLTEYEPNTAVTSGLASQQGTNIQFRRQLLSMGVSYSYSELSPLTRIDALGLKSCPVRCVQTCFPGPPTLDCTPDRVGKPFPTSCVSRCVLVSGSGPCPAFDGTRTVAWTCEDTGAWRFDRITRDDCG